MTCARTPHSPTLLVRDPISQVPTLRGRRCARPPQVIAGRISLRACGLRQVPADRIVLRSRAGPTILGKGIPMRLFLAAALALAAFVAAARAEIIDLSTKTCQQFQAMDKDEIGIILSWLDGYYRDEDDPAVIDTEKFVERAKKLGEYCSANPSIGLITATDKLFGK